MAANESAMDAKTDHRLPLVEDGPSFEGTDVCVENLFDYLDNGWNLYAFLDSFPSVSVEQALAAIEAKVTENASAVMRSDQEIMGGTPVLEGTRLPVKSLFDHLAGVYSLDAFLGQFPTVNREQAIAALDIARYAMERKAYEAAAGRAGSRS